MVEHAFSHERCIRVFDPLGLEPLSAESVAEWLKRDAPVRQRDALVRDEAVGSMSPWVNDVVRRSQGLPAYIALLVDDLKAGELHVGAKVPRGLRAYFTALMQRSGVDDAAAALPVILAALAIAVEAPSAGLLGEILRNCGHLRSEEAHSHQQVVADALGRARAMVRSTQTPQGDDAYLPYHSAFSEFLASTPELANARASAAIGWRRVCTYAAKLNDPAVREEVLGVAIRQLAELGDLSTAISLISDSQYLGARLGSGGDYNVYSDYLVLSMSRVEYERLLQVLDELKTRFADNPDAMQQITRMQGQALAMLSRWREARSVYDSLEESEGHLGRVSAIVNSQLRHNLIGAESSEMRRALGILKQVTPVLSGKGHALEARIEGNIGAIHIHHGRFQSGLESSQHALERLRSHGTCYDCLVAMTNIACAQLRLGDHESAASVLERAVVLAQESGSAWGKACAVYNLGWAHLLAGDAQAAKVEFSVAREGLGAVAEQPARQADLGLIVCSLSMPDQDGDVELERQLANHYVWFGRLDAQYPERFLIAVVRAWLSVQTADSLSDRLAEAWVNLHASEELFLAPCLRPFYGQSDDVAWPVVSEPAAFVAIPRQPVFIVPALVKLRFWAV